MSNINHVHYCDFYFIFWCLSCLVINRKFVGSFLPQSILFFVLTYMRQINK